MATCVAFVALALVPTGSLRAEAKHADRLSGVGVPWPARRVIQSVSRQRRIPRTS
jgi:hypothetical protein